MMTEYELRVLEIDQDEMVKRLEKLGAKKIGEFYQKRYVYDLNPPQKGKWIRLRTNGNETTLTYKNIIDNVINGTKEIEIIVDSFEKTNEFLEHIGFFHRNYQENYRIRYLLDNVEIDIDSWPMIPSYMEIEGCSEEDVLRIKDKLMVEEKNVTFFNCDDIYKDKYGIDISKIKDLKF